MNLYVAVTDPVWFRFLRVFKPEQVNFWRPSGARRFRVLVPGEPLLFKFHYPENYIVGGGFFDSFSIEPAAAAWERYGKGNGVPSLGEMLARIGAYRPKHRPPSPNHTIGCIILTLPFFFEDSAFLPVPEDFSPNTVQGRRYTADSGTGRELWESVRTQRQLSQRGET